MLNASPAISWNDFSLATAESETNNEPSLADSGSYVEFGQANYGGSISYWLPEAFQDTSNLLSNVYELTKEKYHYIDAAVRIDGDTKTTEPVANGDFVSTYRLQSGADQNPFTPGESKRRTVTYSPKDEFSHYTVVGPHTITAIAPATFPASAKGRIRASQGGRDRTNALNFSSSNADRIRVYKGGFYEVPAGATGTATVTITDPGTDDSVTVEIPAIA